MIAYTREWLDALLLKDTAQQWQDSGLITAEKLEAIREQNPSSFYTPNLFIRIGLGIFCLILMYAAMGLLVLLLGGAIFDSDTSFTVFGIFCSVIWIVLLEIWVIRALRHFRSGLDDMMLYVTTFTFLGSVFYSFPYEADELVYCLVAWPFLVAGSIRYLDRLMAAAAFVCALFIVLLIVNEIPHLALYLLPFSGMLFSAGVWWWARQAQKDPVRRHWHGLFWVLELLSLPAFYASGNYGMVQQVGAAWLNLPVPPIGWFFWAFTFAIPVFYIVQGLRRKDRLLLNIGMGAVAASIATFRYYYHVLPLAWACAIIGAFVFVAAWFIINYLRKKPGAYTYEPGTEAGLLNEIEQQLIAHLIAAQTGKPEAPDETFGGGDFGGGGAGGAY